jgi:hypothetical protein
MLSRFLWIRVLMSLGWRMGGIRVRRDGVRRCGVLFYPILGGIIS